MIRNPDGTFPKGVSGNPAGRKPRVKEEAVLAILSEVAGADEWRALFRQTLRDALGVKVVQDPTTKQTTMVPDAESTAQGRQAAMKVLLSYAVGMPPQHVKVNDPAEPLERFANLTEDQIVAILAELDRVQSAGGVTGGSGTGTSDPATEELS